MLSGNQLKIIEILVIVMIVILLVIMGTMFKTKHEMGAYIIMVVCDILVVILGLLDHTIVSLFVSVWFIYEAHRDYNYLIKEYGDD